MTNEEIRQYIIDKIPYSLDTSGITNKYYVIPVSRMLSLELGVINSETMQKYRIVHHMNDHHVDDERTRCEKFDFIDCLYLLDFLKND